MICHDGVFALSGNGLENLSSALMPQQERHFKDSAVIAEWANRHRQDILADFADLTAIIRHPSNRRMLYRDVDSNCIVIAEKDTADRMTCDLAAKQWSRRSIPYYHVWSKFPMVLGFNADGTALYDLAKDSAQQQSGLILIMTNAIKLGTDRYERLRRVIPRMTFEKAAGSIVGAYLFVSNDLQQWAIADGKELPQEWAGAFKDFAVLRCPCSVRYFAMLVAGVVSKFTLTHFSIEYDTRYGNKIR
jgi:hypothetical protein